MTVPQRAILLIGSAKPAGESTSEALSAHILEGLSARGIATETYYVARVLRTALRTQEFLAAVDQADLFILAFPLYVDSPPYLVTEMMERLAAHRLEQTTHRQTAFLAIANCGFPEAHHNATALAICKEFSNQAGFQWSGGLALGEGGVIHGQRLTEAGGMMREVVTALNEIAAALATGESAPDQALAKMGRPIIPALAYMLVGDIGWLQEARRNHALTRLGAQPFREVQQNQAQLA